MGVSIWEGNKAQDLINAITQRFGIVGLSESAKQALLNCFEHVAWADEHGQEYYSALEDALNEQTGLVRISAIFNQGTAIFYPTTPLNDLKAYLTVTAYYNNGSTELVTDYALSGTLEVGTSTITVSKDQKTDVFDVVVSVSPWVYDWSATSGVNPPDMTGYSFDFNSEPGAVKVIEPNLTIDVEDNEYEAIIVCKFSSYPQANNPKMSFNAYESSTDNFNVQINPNSTSDNVSLRTKMAFVTNWISSAKEFTSYEQTAYHEYRVVREGSTLKVYIDNTLVKTFTKVDDSEHVTNNQFRINSATTTMYDIYIKSIKVRIL